jgi:hypothetical protein
MCEIRAWGACKPTDCEWGATKLHLLGDTVSSQTLPYGFAKWDQGFAEVNVTLDMADDKLVIGMYKIFKDDSGRSNYRRVERFRRETSPPEASRAGTSNRHQYAVAGLKCPVSYHSNLEGGRRGWEPTQPHVVREGWAVYCSRGRADFRNER